MNELNKIRVVFRLIVSAFLSLIMKRLLDSALDSWKRDDWHWHNVFAGFTLFVILIQTFRGLINLAEDDKYGHVLEKSRQPRIWWLCGITIVTLIVTYVMADLASASEVLDFILWTAFLTLAWLAFDLTLYYTLRSSEKGGSENLPTASIHWMFCDGLLLLSMGSVWYTRYRNMIEGTDATLITLMMFLAVAYLMELSLPSGTERDDHDICGISLLSSTPGHPENGPVVAGEVATSPSVVVARRSGWASALLAGWFLLLAVGILIPRRNDRQNSNSNE